METASIRAGDIVECNVRGDQFYATVDEPTHYDETLKKRGLRVTSLTRRPIPTSFVTPRQIVGHWRKSRRNSNKEG